MKSKQIFGLCIYISFFVISVINAIPGTMLTSLIDQYSLQSAAQGAPGAAISFGQALALIFLFWQAGRIAKPTIVAFSLAGIAVLLFAVSFMPPFVLLVFLFALLGIVFGAISSTSSSMVADLHPGVDASKYMSRLHGIFGLGGLVAPLFFMRLLNAGFHWNIALRITGAAIAVLTLLFTLLSRISLKSIELPKRSGLKVNKKDFKSFFKRGSNILLVLCVFFYAAHQCVIGVWLVRYVTVFLGSGALGAPALSLYWAGVTFSRLFTHRILPASPIKILLYGNLAAGLVMLGGIFSGSAAAATVCKLIVGIVNGTTLPVLLATGCADNDGNTILPTSLLNLAMFIAYVVTPLAVGVLVDYASLRSGMLLSAFFALICGSVVFLYIRTKPTGTRSRPLH